MYSSCFSVSYLSHNSEKLNSSNTAEKLKEIYKHETRFRHPAKQCKDQMEEYKIKFREREPSSWLLYPRRFTLATALVLIH